MTDLATPDTYGTLIEPTTLKIQRVLPGPIERVWAYLTESDLRRQWLASGEMEMKAGSTFEFVWRNDELTNPPGQRPPGFSGEHRMEGSITEVDPPRKLAITWGSTGGVTFELERKRRSCVADPDPQPRARPHDATERQRRLAYASRRAGGTHGGNADRAVLGWVVAVEG